jgi:hypothetical protein
MPKTQVVVTTTRREKVIKDVLDRIDRDPEELPYFEVLVEVIEVLDNEDLDASEIMRSAMLSRVAVRCPWLLDRVARRAA